ncbi:hypothetical protein M977_00049 [Buttiauxella gaviniae ATCC 51604]|uniref:Uncharacterized protein n=1 Tax=Buttiauxella gaviniae ATCC 51604 TaxID=1354253 RepID=A0A1B7I733_9ENTR|nr:hypothetical protein [Buttiauxella gaviniae]OAT24218.1 hypothetical protein M977_00049 [Buttiauxella gaviniae ATCC 51604]
MAPSLIDERYNKQLNKMPLSMGGYTILETFHFATPGGDVVRLVEMRADNGEFDNFLVVYLLPSYNSDYQFDEITRVMDEEGLNAFQAAEHIIKIEIVDATLSPEELKVVGRFAYNDFPFIGVDGNEYLGKQIKGAYLEPPFDSARIGSTAYRFILDKYRHLVCDNLQTILGASMWSGTMRRYGEVMIYDTVKKCCLDQLGDKAKGSATGFLPWDIGSLPLSRVTDEWGDRELRLDKGSCTHIVNIISLP